MKVFVYGTLRMGHGNNHLLHKAKFLGEATTNGLMYSMGYIPFVSLKHKSNENIVHGEVYEIDEDILQRLDRLEGYYPARPDHSFYNRSLVSTSLGDAYIYHIDHDTDRNRIEGGDWVKYMKGSEGE